MIWLIFTISTFLQHPTVSECCVLGLPDKDYGEIVCAIIVPKEKQDKESKPPLSLEELSNWAKNKLAPYKVWWHGHCLYVFYMYVEHIKWEHEEEEDSTVNTKTSCAISWYAPYTHILIMEIRLLFSYSYKSYTSFHGICFVLLNYIRRTFHVLAKKYMHMIYVIFLSKNVAIA